MAKLRYHVFMCVFFFFPLISTRKLVNIPRSNHAFLAWHFILVENWPIDQPNGRAFRTRAGFWLLAKKQFGLDILENLQKTIGFTIDFFCLGHFPIHRFWDWKSCAYFGDTECDSVCPPKNVLLQETTPSKKEENLAYLSMLRDFPHVFNVSSTWLCMYIYIYNVGLLKPNN